MHDKDLLLAHYYDIEYRDFTEDLDFYVQYALYMDPTRRLPLLELGCGTGRVALALAEAGFAMVGTDISEGMLAILRERANEKGVSERVHAAPTDMRDLSSVQGGPFNLALCALNTFAYLTTTEDQLRMLRAVHPLLVQHGLLILDLTSPMNHLLPPGDGEMVHQGSFDAKAEGTLHKFISGRAQTSTQSHSVTLFYDLEGLDGTLERTTQALTLRWAGRYEMELLLQAAGYKVENMYGDYELGDYVDGSERMIFIART